MGIGRGQMSWVSQESMNYEKIEKKKSSYMLFSWVLLLYLIWIGKGNSNKIKLPSTENSLGCPFCSHLVTVACNCSMVNWKGNILWDQRDLSLNPSFLLTSSLTLCTSLNLSLSFPTCRMGLIMIAVGMKQNNVGKSIGTVSWRAGNQSYLPLNTSASNSKRYIFDKND